LPKVTLRAVFLASPACQPANYIFTTLAVQIATVKFFVLNRFYISNVYIEPIKVTLIQPVYYLWVSIFYVRPFEVSVLWCN